MATDYLVNRRPLKSNFTSGETLVKGQYTVEDGDERGRAEKAG